MRSTKRLLFMFAIIVLWYDLNSALAQQYGWKVIARPTNRDLNAIEFVDGLHGWCAGSDGNIFFTKNGGLTWWGSVRPSDPIITGLSFSDSLNGWAVGNYAGSAGLIWRTDNGGINWTQQVAPDTRFVLRYWSTSAQSLTNNTTVGTRFALADTGILRITADGGASWKRQKISDSIAGYGKVVFADSQHGWITAGLRNGASALLRTRDGGKNWEIVPVQQGLPVITFLDARRGWGAYGGDIYQTKDGGSTWKFVSRAFDPMWDYLHTATLSFVDSLNGWAFGNMFYRGIITEAIYRTTNGGANWIQESVGLTDDFGGVNDAKMLDHFHGWAVCGRGSVLRYQLITAVVEKLPQLPQHFHLYQNYPNPFNPATTIEYEVIHPTLVTIKVYDLAGREVAQLVEGEYAPGVYRVHFDGSGLASGTYYYTMQAGTFSETKPMMLFK